MKNWKTVSGRCLDVALDDPGPAQMRSGRSLLGLGQPVQPASQKYRQARERPREAERRLRDPSEQVVELRRGLPTGPVVDPGCRTCSPPSAS